ncbi:sigma 54-interacting transcriptional regulator [Myxococcota bacterium]|nr:sigma 54-interacting transcriptional regulator [Myxococcota bacterium]
MSDATLVLEVLTGARAGARLTVDLPCSVGRAASAALCLPDAHLSGLHGQLRREGDALYYLDKGSSNGSRHVRGKAISRLEGHHLEAELWDGDELHLGVPEEAVILRVSLPEPAAGEIIAVRPIAEVERFADRITASPTRLHVLYRHSASLGESTDLDAVLRVATQLVFDLLPKATHLAVALKERAGRFPVVHAAARQAKHKSSIPLSKTILRKVLDKKAGLLVTNAAAEFSTARSIVQAGIASTLSVPLWTGADVRGVLQVDNRDAPGLFDAEDLEVLTVAAAHISFAAENARLVARLRLAEQRLEGENRYLKTQAQAQTFQGIVGESATMMSVLQMVERVRDTRVPVLILGETGTGKELIARALHYTSKRADKLFIPQNCSALPEHLLESELFGHTRGAFTGADRDKKGLFELADEGTIFLDEIGEMPSSLQAKLLRVLQEGEIWPLGASAPKRVDVRIVSATHRDLEVMVKEGSFRQDLFYRLHVYPIALPPLRERREDIPILSRYFIRRYAREFGRSITGLTPEAQERLISYRWPGNIRELQNELQRILIQRMDGDLILVEDLSPKILGQTSLIDGPQIPRGTLKDMLIAVERVLIARALRENSQNKTQTAKVLGITREGLHKKLARFGMNY